MKKRKERKEGRMKDERIFEQREIPPPTRVGVVFVWRALQDCEVGLLMRQEQLYDAGRASRSKSAGTSAVCAFFINP